MSLCFYYQSWKKNNWKRIKYNARTKQIEQIELPLTHFIDYLIKRLEIAIGKNVLKWYSWK